MIFYFEIILYEKYFKYQLEKMDYFTIILILTFR